MMEGFSTGTGGIPFDSAATRPSKGWGKMPGLPRLFRPMTGAHRIQSSGGTVCERAMTPKAVPYGFELPAIQKSHMEPSLYWHLRSSF